MTAATVETWECGWLVSRGHDEDGEEIIVPCGAAATADADGVGWSCEAGHAHRGVAVEWAEDAARAPEAWL